MNLRRLLRLLSLDTGVFGLLTVGLVYVLTHSGALILGLAGFGVLCIALGGGTAGQVTAAGAGYAEDSGLGMLVEDMGIWPGSSPDIPVRVRLLFYGLGLLGWSLIVLGLLSSTLQ